MAPTFETQLGHLHVTVSLYAVAIALGVGSGMLIAVRHARRPDVVLLAAALAVAGGILAADAWHRVLHQSPGLSSMGGIACGLAIVVAVSRATRAATREVLDAIAPGALVGFAIGRVGCFLAGCCYGLPTELPWGVVLPALGPPARHPVQLYETAVDLGLAWWCASRSSPTGRAAGRAMIGYGVGRAALEMLRDPGGTDVLDPRWPPVAQQGAVVLVVMGAWACRRAATSLDKATRPVGP